MAGARGGDALRRRPAIPRGGGRLRRRRARTTSSAASPPTLPWLPQRPWRAALLSPLSLYRRATPLVAAAVLEALAASVPAVVDAFVGASDADAAGRSSGSPPRSPPPPQLSLESRWRSLLPARVHDPNAPPPPPVSRFSLGWRAARSAASARGEARLPGVASRVVLPNGCSPPATRSARTGRSSIRSARRRSSPSSRCRSSPRAVAPALPRLLPRPRPPRLSPRRACLLPASVVSFACSAVLKFATAPPRPPRAHRPRHVARRPARRLRIADERSQAAGVAVIDVALLQRSASDPENVPMKPEAHAADDGADQGRCGGEAEPKRRRLVGRAAAPPATRGASAPARASSASRASLLFVKRSDPLAALINLAKIPTAPLRCGSSSSPSAKIQRT